METGIARHVCLSVLLLQHIPSKYNLNAHEAGKPSQSGVMVVRFDFPSVPPSLASPPCGDPTSQPPSSLRARASPHATLAPFKPATMSTSPWTPDSQYLSTVLNEPNALAPHVASTQAPAQTHTSTPPRPRPSSTHPHPHPHPHPQHHQHAQPSPLTAAQRSAQARGKPFAAAAAAAHSSNGARTAQPPNEAESYALRQRRSEAAAILDSQEMLLWYSAARHESVAQTREFYRRVVLGVGHEAPVWREGWQRGAGGEAGERASPRGRGKGRERERERERERGRERGSSAGGAHGGPGEGGF
ncbi:uncharacterized protein EKO05_0006386 [Ascochyta rabiei]|uniref:uncharacterized protein n=1 Tax=Didymella rabiei TaxID=5454 RepID=UPI0021FACE7B|nr:uncharacterized protein EKO05_0006386 [Ascochyta rabiei]UPX15956.1 hypothetical protein EKO05_0006386 [Ascochyta rabiei]